MPDVDETSEPLRLSGYRAATEYVLLCGLGIFEFPGKDRRIEPINMRLYGQPLEPWQMRMWGVRTRCGELKTLMTAPDRAALGEVTSETPCHGVHQPIGGLPVKTAN